MLNQDLIDRHFADVGNVECVAKNDLPKASIDKMTVVSTKALPTELGKQNVEPVAINDLSGYFATLSTELKIKSVESTQITDSLIINELGIIPHIPRYPQDDNKALLNSENFNGRKQSPILDWLRIAVEEGHIEPSQPQIGCLVGWPVRKIKANTLFADFQLWCARRKIPYWETPCKLEFCSMADKVFIRDDDAYAFPALECSRAKFLLLEGA